MENLSSNLSPPFWVSELDTKSSGSLDAMEKAIDYIRRAGCKTAKIAAELCNILGKAHSCSLAVDGKELRAIIHGDIKPRNIRLDAKGQVRVLDFGIAKGLSLTRKLTSNYYGSVLYSSPERLETDRIDESSDLWSVGVVLYEMIDGRPPFEAETTERLERLIREHTPPRPLSQRCSRELQAVVHKALASSAERRYRSAEKLRRPFWRWKRPGAPASPRKGAGRLRLARMGPLPSLDGPVSSFVSRAGPRGRPGWLGSLRSR